MVFTTCLISLYLNLSQPPIQSPQAKSIAHIEPLHHLYVSLIHQPHINSNLILSIILLQIQYHRLYHLTFNVVLIIHTTT